MLVHLIAVNQTDPYDSDSSDGGSEFPLQSTIPEPQTWNYLVDRMSGKDDFPTLFQYALIPYVIQ
jgi:hypothetical protein